MEPREERKTEHMKQTPVYVPPKIITHTSEEILEEIGPAPSCSCFLFKAGLGKNLLFQTNRRRNLSTLNTQVFSSCFCSTPLLSAT